jgi:hypothetical protein
VSLSKAEADAELAAIEDVVGRVRQSRVYRVSGEIAVMWGALQCLQFAVMTGLPTYARGWGWIYVDALGVALTLVMLARAGPTKPARLARALAAFALFYGFGFLWSYGLFHFGGREMAVFWRTLFLFGYCLAGLWFGLGFLAIGLGLTALIFAVYLFAGSAFWPLIALVTGLGYILCGLWMRRA